MKKVRFLDFWGVLEYTGRKVTFSEAKRLYAIYRVRYDEAEQKTREALAKVNGKVYRMRLQ